MANYNVALRMKYEQQCPDCGDSDFVEDHATGDLICRVRFVSGLELLRLPARP
jgi:ribosomal protein S27AE